MRLERHVSGYADHAWGLFDVSAIYLLMGRDRVNLHSGKRLEGMLRVLSGINAEQKMRKKTFFLLILYR